MAKTIRREKTLDPTKHYPRKRARKIEKRRDRQASRHELESYR